jgi:hypothetical protein
MASNNKCTNPEQRKSRHDMKNPQLEFDSSKFSCILLITYYFTLHYLVYYSHV